MGTSARVSVGIQDGPEVFSCSCSGSSLHLWSCHPYGGRCCLRYGPVLPLRPRTVRRCPRHDPCQAQHLRPRVQCGRPRRTCRHQVQRPKSKDVIGLFVAVKEEEKKEEAPPPVEEAAPAEEDEGEAKKKKKKKKKAAK